MENKKKLRINCDICDARKVQESVLAAYESVHINCDFLLANPEARELLSRYGVSVNADRIMDLEDEVRTSSVNGRMELKPGQAATGYRVLLCVNGSLEIAPGCEEMLKSFLSIMVNGRIVCPESVVPLLTGASVNGSIDAYPDGCILLKSTAVLDRTFHLRAKQDALYYAAGRVVALSPDIEFEKLAAKNVRFSTKKLLVAESLAERAVPLFDERADIEVLPDGCFFLNDDAKLDESLLRRCGGRLYLNGDLTVGQAGIPLLERFAFLQVNGDILAIRAAAAALGKITAKYNNVCLVAGTHLSGRASVVLDRVLLEGAEDGLSVTGCALVQVREDVPPALLREKMVSLAGCASVLCTEAQRAVLEPLANDVGCLGVQSKEEQLPEDGAGKTVISANIYML